MTNENNTIKTYWLENVHAQSLDSIGSERVMTMCPRLICADGFSMSVQASEFTYCSPREFVADGSYDAWEVGFPTNKEPLLMPYAEEAKKPMGTVYGYVPTEVINAVIKKHGGIKEAGHVAGDPEEWPLLSSQPLLSGGTA